MSTPHSVIGLIGPLPTFFFLKIRASKLRRGRRRRSVLRILRILGERLSKRQGRQDGAGNFRAGSSSPGGPRSRRRTRKITDGSPSPPRYPSFTPSIPYERCGRHDLDAEDLSATTSYLRNGVEKWAELNISASFSSFKREVLPLCESLPQILHFEDKIMGLLASYIGRREKEALEALLDLLTAFAHDLGSRFEKHYARSLGLIVDLASKPQPAEVIEWTFGALAFLFKYLSRLLVPDLRPTYDALSPLLGKSRQPGHIARFAGEAMSFLVKKAAAPANRDRALPLIVNHAAADSSAQPAPSSSSSTTTA